MDLVDYITDHATSVQTGAVPSTKVKYIVAVQVGRKLDIFTYEGRASECQDRVMRRFKVDISKPDVRWARGYLDERSGALVIHPRNDKQAEQMIIARLKRLHGRKR